METLKVKRYRAREVAGLFAARLNFAATVKGSPAGGLQRRSRAQANGLRYERRAVEKLELVLPGFLDHPVFDFFSYGNGGQSYGLAIPDGIVVDAKRNMVTVVEVKLRHSREAWSQLADFYGPIVAKSFPGLRVRLLEVCKSYEPEAAIPGVPVLTSVAGFAEHSAAIWVWRGR